MSEKDSKIEKTPEPTNVDKLDSLMKPDFGEKQKRRRVKKNYIKGSRIPIEMT